MTDLAYDLLDKDISHEEYIALEDEAMQKCYDGFVDEGIDLSAYNSVESAADLNDLRLALGYDEWNLLGVSYGTRLALTAMRDFPEGIRSVILSSTYPVEENIYTMVAANYDRALNILYGDCADNPVSNRAYPDLRNALREVIEKLNASPATFRITHPLTQQTYDALIDGSGFFDMIITMLYSTDSIPIIPKVVYDAKSDKYDTLALLMGSDLVNMELISMGMHYSVQCSEELPFTSPDEITASMEDYPDIMEFTQGDAGQEMFDVCEYWTTSGPDPKENQAVHSSIPTLILSGEYDPITPPSWGMTVRDDLANSYFYEFPGLGHDTIFSGDEHVLDVALSFLDNPDVQPAATEPVPAVTEPEKVEA